MKKAKCSVCGKVYTAFSGIGLNNSTVKAGNCCAGEKALRRLKEHQEEARRRGIEKNEEDLQKKREEIREGD